MSKLHKLVNHRSYLCDDFFKKIVLNPKHKLDGLLPYNSVISSEETLLFLFVKRAVLKIVSSLQPLGCMTIVVFTILYCNFYLVICKTF